MRLKFCKSPKLFAIGSFILVWTAIAYHQLVAMPPCHIRFVYSKELRSGLQFVIELYILQFFISAISFEENRADHLKEFIFKL